MLKERAWEYKDWDMGGWYFKYGAWGRIHWEVPARARLAWKWEVAMEISFLPGLRQEPLWCGRGMVWRLVWLERESEDMMSETATHFWLWLLFWVKCGTFRRCWAEEGHNPNYVFKKITLATLLRLLWHMGREAVRSVSRKLSNPGENWWCLGRRYLQSLLVLEETLNKQRTHVCYNNLDCNFCLIWLMLHGEKNVAFYPKQL